MEMSQWQNIQTTLSQPAKLTISHRTVPTYTKKRAGTFHVSGPGSMSSTSFDADNTVTATDSTIPAAIDR
jgi:hypothetical protein